MGRQRIGCPRALLKRERDPFFRTSRQHMLFQSPKGLETSELCLEVRGPIHPFLRYRRIQLERSPDYLRPSRILQLTQGPFQPSLSDVAPGTDDVGIDLDHESLIAHDKCPI